MRRLSAVVLALATIGAPATVWAETAGSMHVRLSPARGGPKRVFVLSWRTPDQLGRDGSVNRTDTVSAATTTSARGCVKNFDLSAPNAKAGTVVRVRVDPRRLGGHWCTGGFRGQVDELQSPVCPYRELCPAYVLLRREGRFSFAVRRAG
jgi:hypothetical protein